LPADGAVVVAGTDRPAGRIKRQHGTMVKLRGKWYLCASVVRRGQKGARRIRAEQAGFDRNLAYAAM